MELWCRLAPTDQKTPTDLASLGHLPQEGEASAPAHPLGAQRLIDLRKSPCEALASQG